MKTSKISSTTWQQSRGALLVSVAVGLILAYAFISRALDTGSYWQYLGAVVFLTLAVKLFARALKVGNDRK